MEKRLLICGSFQREARVSGSQETDFRRPARAANELHFELHALKLAGLDMKNKEPDVPGQPKNSTLGCQSGSSQADF